MCAICYVNMYGNIQFPQDFCVIFICVFIKKYAIFFCCFVTNLRDAKMTLFPDDFHSVHLTKNKTCAMDNGCLMTYSMYRPIKQCLKMLKAL